MNNVHMCTLWELWTEINKNDMTYRLECKDSSNVNGVFDALDVLVVLQV